MKSYLKSLTEDQRKRFGKLLLSAIRADKRAHSLEQELGKAISGDVKRLERKKDLAGLHSLSQALSPLFLNHFVYEAIYKVQEKRKHERRRTKGPF